MIKRQVVGDYYTCWEGDFYAMVISSNGSYLIFDPDGRSIDFHFDDEPLYLPQEWALI